MNNGHTGINQQAATSDLLFEQGISEGAGAEDVEINTFEAENNLNTNNSDAHWDNTTETISPTANQDTSENTEQARRLDLGSNAVKASESSTDGKVEQLENHQTEQPSITTEQTQTVTDQIQSTPNLEQTTNLSMPPGMNSPVDEHSPNSSMSPQSNPDHIKITEHLNEAGVKATEHAISDFQQNGDAASFIERVNSLKEEAIASLGGGTE